MPQIEQLAATYSSQIFWLLVFFGLTFFVIGRGMVPKVMQTVELRDRQIANDLAGAQAARDQADAQEEAWRQRENANRASAQALLAEAKDNAARESERLLAEAQQRLGAKQDEAEGRLAEQRRAAVAQIEGIAAEAARDVAARIAGVHVDEAEAHAAVREVMHHG